MKRKEIYMSVILLLFLIVIIWRHSECTKRPIECTKRPINILLIIVDSLRADHLGCYGYERNTTPNIDRFAKEGVLFTQAIAQSSWTGISVPSILTSTYPHTHLVYNWGEKLNPSISILPQILKKEDYCTAFITNLEPIRSIPNMRKGFDIFDLQKGFFNDRRLTLKVIEWLRKNKDLPFFLYIHYQGAHSPYRPPPPYDKIYLFDQFNKRNEHLPIGKDNVRGCIPKFVVENNITAVDYYIAKYDGTIKFVDEQIGMLLKELKMRNLYKNTLIIFTADHGECLGEHNMYFTHGIFLYDILLKVPLIIKCPLIPPNKVIETQVQLIDIMPTILDCLKIKKAKSIEGVSLLPLMTGKEEYPNPYAFSDSELNKKSIRTEEWKLIYNLDGGKYELYSLKQDPKELINLVEIEKEKFDFLKGKLNEWMKQSCPRILKTTQPIDEETKERLKSLGYSH